MPAKLKNKKHSIKKFFFGRFMESKKKVLTSIAKDKKTINAVKAINSDELKPTLISK